MHISYEYYITIWCLKHDSRKPKKTINIYHDSINFFLSYFVYTCWLLRNYNTLHNTVQSRTTSRIRRKRVGKDLQKTPRKHEYAKSFIRNHKIAYTFAPLPKPYNIRTYYIYKIGYLGYLYGIKNRYIWRNIESIFSHLSIFWAQNSLANRIKTIYTPTKKCVKIQM